ncbi:hypothetical protein O77CONTIG1_00116 [Leptolyngbya sp. O-77]|nr:hypothetical protein O77CONTIG1_00116 [Leptolyngbya sp. O-77]
MIQKNYKISLISDSDFEVCFFKQKISAFVLSRSSLDESCFTIWLSYAVKFGYDRFCGYILEC